MTELERDSLVVEAVLNALLIRGGRASNERIALLIVQLADQLGVPDTTIRDAIVKGRDHDLYMRLGHQLVLCRAGWAAIADSTNASLT